MLHRHHALVSEIYKHGPIAFMLNYSGFWRQLAHRNWTAGILRWFVECCSSAVCECGIPCRPSEDVLHLCRSDLTDTDLYYKGKYSYNIASNSLSIVRIVTNFKKHFSAFLVPGYIHHSVVNSNFFKSFNCCVSYRFKCQDLKYISFIS